MTSEEIRACRRCGGSGEVYQNGGRKVRCQDCEAAAPPDRVTKVKCPRCGDGHYVISHSPKGTGLLMCPCTEAAAPPCAGVEAVMEMFNDLGRAGRNEGRAICKDDSRMAKVLRGETHKIQAEIGSAIRRLVADAVNGERERAVKIHNDQCLSMSCSEGGCPYCKMFAKSIREAT